MAQQKTIYFAGGCFWGVEHFFKGVDGVTGTMPGYANGSTEAIGETATSRTTSGTHVISSDSRGYP